ncbi:APC family permease [Microbacterium sp. ASV49]|uniref:APC family permease n=1 Tax=Microbacterium candidum TaxID=3041922 RepID=A0ABT7N2B8_9MICO|nr:APC family permease [Microbacterium sp. ASV49]MDL9980818.1 APC family permease [Microbacterium sp. ASV49]
MSEELDGELLEAAGAAGTKAPATVPDTGKYAQQLSRGLTFKENILITLSAVTPASSVFIIVPAVINGIGGASALAFVIAGVIGIFVALCYAELSSAFPITGGEYAFVARTLGKPWGFGLFLMNLVSGVLIIGVIASGASQYLGVLSSALGGGWVGIVVILVTTVIACFGIRTNALVTGIFLLLEIAALVVLTLVGFLHVQQPISTLWTPVTSGPGGILVPAAAGLIVAYTSTALFAFNGYGAAVYYAEETKNARSTIGRAIMWSLAIAVLAELIPLIAVLLGTSDMAKLVASPSPMTEFLTTEAGSTVNTLVSIGIAIAVINAVLAIILQFGRTLFSSARDRSWPDGLNRAFGHIHPKLRTPVVATLVVGVISALCLWLVPFDVLLVATSAGIVILYALVGLAALIGRINHTTDAAEYRMRWWPAAPILMIVATLVILVMTVIADWVPVAVAVGIFAAGLIYYVLYLRGKPDRWTLPEPADEELEEETA